MDFQDKLVHVIFYLVSVLEVSSAQLGDLLLENMSIPKVLQISELNPVSKFQTRPFKNIDDGFYSYSYYAESGLGRNKKIVQPERIKTGNSEISKWNGNEELAKQNRDQLKWLTNLKLIFNIAKKLNKLNSQIKKLQNMSKIIADLKAEVSQMKKSIPVNSFVKSYKKKSLNDEIENKKKTSDKNTSRQVNNISYYNQYRVGNTYIINVISKEKDSSLTDVEIVKELTDHKIEELLEKVVNNLTEGEIPPVSQSHQQEYETDLLKQLQRNFSDMFNHQNVTFEHVEQMSKIVDFVKRYHGVISDLNIMAKWDKSKDGRHKELGDKWYKNVDKKKAMKNMNEKGRVLKRGRRPG